VGFVPSIDSRYREIAVWLLPTALATERGVTLASVIIEELRARRILTPPIAVIERLYGEVEAQALAQQDDFDYLRHTWRWARRRRYRWRAPRSTRGTLMPHVKIRELLAEVDRWTGFADRFVHQRTLALTTQRQTPLGQISSGRFARAPANSPWRLSVHIISVSCLLSKLFDAKHQLALSLVPSC
jgi:hypothetical protein